MPTVAIVSPCGGTGRSTLAALLATLSARSGVWALAVECDPQNLLALHFGAAQAPVHGLASRAARAQAWNTAALAAKDGTLLLPFGALDPPALVDWERRLVTEPDWLAASLGSLARPANGWTFIDTPRLPAVLARQAVRAADLALLVLRADAASMALLEAALAMLEGTPTYAVVNAYEAGARLPSDVLAALYDRLGSRLAPKPVHRDEAIPEAFARRRSPDDHSPHAQAVHDLHGLLRWLQRQCQPMKEPRTGSNVV